jgi:hypothetical protein
MAHKYAPQIAGLTGFVLTSVVMLLRIVFH